MPPISTIAIVFYPLNFGFKVFKFIDQGWTEFFGAQQIFNYFVKISSFFQLIQFNNLKIHMTLFCFWLILLVFIIVLLV
jgi:hypothetical protein